MPNLDSDGDFSTEVFHLLNHFRRYALIGGLVWPLCVAKIIKDNVVIISHKYKFIFIKTMKTAGTSIEVFLSPLCGDDDIVTPIWPNVEPHCARNYKGIWNPLPEILENKGSGVAKILIDLYKRNNFYNHIPAFIVRNRVPKKLWNSYFKFCVERNPWDKTLSHYHMLNDRAGGNVSFDEYINKGDFCLNYPFYCDSKGKILVDKIVKYESLMDELRVIFQKLGVPFDGSLGVKAKSEHRKDKRPYQEVFSNEQRDVIAKAFAKEVKMHGYSF